MAEDNHRFRPKPRYSTPKFPFPIKLDGSRLLHEFTYYGSRVPVAGKWISRGNHIYHAFATGGNPDPWLFVYAAWISVPRLLYAFAKPFIQAEVAYRFLNQHCGKKRKGILYDFAKRAAIDAESEAAFFPEAQVLGWTGFQVLGEFALKAEWYFFLADRATEFVNNTASLPFQWTGNFIQGDAWFAGDSGPGLFCTFDDRLIIDDKSGNKVDFITTGCQTHPGFGCSGGYSITDKNGAACCMRVNGINLPNSSGQRKKNTDGSWTTTFLDMYLGDPTVSGATWEIQFLNGERPDNTTAHAHMWVSGSWVGRGGLDFDP